MKIAVLALFLLGAAAAADTAEAKDELVEVFGAESSEEDTDAASRRRRRRWGHRHRPHGHWPHGHNPHWHHPHVHSPHSHSDCFEATRERYKVQFLKDSIERNKKDKENCQAELDRLNNLLYPAEDLPPMQDSYPREIQWLPGLIEETSTIDVTTEEQVALVEFKTKMHEKLASEIETLALADDPTTEEIEADIETQEKCIDHHGAEMERKNEQVKNIKKKLRQNDCTDTVRWINNACEAVAKWIEDLINFLLTFKCTIIDIAVKVLGKLLDFAIPGIPYVGAAIASMKGNPWCKPAFPSKGKKPPPPPPLSASMRKVSYLATLFFAMPIKAAPTYKEVFIWMVMVWGWIVGMIDDKKLDNIYEDSLKVIYFVLVVWDVSCGLWGSALMTLGKDILYCNVPSLNCPCKAPVLKF